MRCYLTPAPAGSAGGFVRARKKRKEGGHLTARRVYRLPAPSVRPTQPSYSKRSTDPRHRPRKGKEKKEKRKGGEKKETSNSQDGFEGDIPWAQGGLPTSDVFSRPAAPSTRNSSGREKKKREKEKRGGEGQPARTTLVRLKEGLWRVNAGRCPSRSP